MGSYAGGVNRWSMQILERIFDHLAQNSIYALTNVSHNSIKRIQFFTYLFYLLNDIFSEVRLCVILT